jgi:hypothetical protein
MAVNLTGVFPCMKEEVGRMPTWNHGLKDFCFVPWAARNVESSKRDFRKQSDGVFRELDSRILATRFDRLS